MFTIDHLSVYISHYDTAVPIMNASDAFSNNGVFIIIRQRRARVLFTSRFPNISPRQIFTVSIGIDVSKIRSSIVLKMPHNGISRMCTALQYVLWRTCATHARINITIFLSHISISNRIEGNICKCAANA